MGIDSEKKIPDDAQNFKFSVEQTEVDSLEKKLKQKPDFIENWLKENGYDHELEKITANPGINYYKGDLKNLNNQIEEIKDKNDTGYVFLKNEIAKIQQKTVNALEDFIAANGIEKKAAAGVKDTVKPDKNKTEERLEKSGKPEEQDTAVFIDQVTNSGETLEEQKIKVDERMKVMIKDGGLKAALTKDYQNLRSFFLELNKGTEEQEFKKEEAVLESKPADSIYHKEEIDKLEAPAVPEAVIAEEEIKPYKIDKAVEEVIDDAIKKFIDSDAENNFPEAIKKAYGARIRTMAADYKMLEPNILKEKLKNNREKIKNLKPDTDDLYKKGIAKQKIEDLEEANKIIKIILDVTKKETETEEQEKTPMEIIYDSDEEIQRLSKMPGFDENIKLRKEQINEMIETYKTTGNKGAFFESGFYNAKDKIKLTKLQKAIFAAIEKKEIKSQFDE